MIRNILVELENLLKIISTLRNEGKRIVFTTGAYDIIHSGHIDYFDKASELGNVLIVGLHSDSLVKERKGPGRPLNNEAERVKVLSSIYFINYLIVINNFDNLYKIINRILPDVLVVSETNKREKDNSPEIMDILFGEIMEVIVLPEQGKIHSTDFIKLVG